MDRENTELGAKTDFGCDVSRIFGYNYFTIDAFLYTRKHKDLE